MGGSATLRFTGALGAEEGWRIPILRGHEGGEQAGHGVRSLIDKLEGAQWFTTLDCRSGYWQFPLDEESKKYTAFKSVAHSLLEWCRLPMGLKISSGEYQRRIE